jgi:hypothetical protein
VYVVGLFLVRFIDGGLGIRLVVWPFLLVMALGILYLLRATKRRIPRMGWKELAVLPFIAVMWFGFVVLLFTISAEFIVPETWHWPMPKESKVLVLPDGRRAALTEAIDRVQIYDIAGNFLKAWNIPAHGGYKEILGPDPTMGKNTIEVYAVRAAHPLILYSPEGRVLREADPPEHFKANPHGHFEIMTFNTPWYL